MAEDNAVRVKASTIGVDRGGHLLRLKRRPVPKNWPARFTRKIKPHPDGCWYWTASRSNGGYGRFALDGGDTGWITAHRFAFTLENGRIPDGLQVRHICRVPQCVRPDHLEAVTHSDVVRSGDAANADDMCRRGLHLWAGENIYVEADGTQRCRLCRQQTERDESPGIAPAQRTHCPKQHPYDESNTYITARGHRECRTCNRDRQRARYRARNR